MANKQTKSLRKQGKSLRFNHGVNFAAKDLTAMERRQHPEFSIVPFESSKGRCVDSAFSFDRDKMRENGNKRRHAYEAPTKRERKAA